MQRQNMMLSLMNKFHKIPLKKKKSIRSQKPKVIAAKSDYKNLWFILILHLKFTWRSMHYSAPPLASFFQFSLLWTASTKALGALFSWKADVALYYSVEVSSKELKGQR